mmetsp:Transcript_25124/g.63224  ORF Transcript_25124/g.63224 Transcript_25124/m.63224 type:complete len:208 (+) Transcript_25124:750-1373(+)
MSKCWSGGRQPSIMKFAVVTESITGSWVALRIGAAYGGSWVHSSRMPATLGFLRSTSLTSATIPGVTRSTSTFSPAATASKPGTLSAPTIRNRSSSKCKPHSRAIKCFMPSREEPEAVTTITTASERSVAIKIGNMHKEDNPIGTWRLVCNWRTNGWKLNMNPQSPVIAPTSTSSTKYRTASHNWRPTSGVKVPAWAISKVRPGTTR